MATDTESSRAITPFEKAALLLFFVALGVYYFAGEKAGIRVFGVWLLMFALAMHMNGRIEIWISGRPGSWSLTGPLATVLNVLMALLGAAVVIWPEVPMLMLERSGR